jgi:hypothetical protein
MHSLQASTIYITCAVIEHTIERLLRSASLAQEMIVFGKLVITYLKVEGTGNITSANY